MLRLFCPASGGKLVERTRISANPRGPSLVACTCDDNWSGPTCQTFTEPARPTHTTHDKSVSVWHLPDRGMCVLFWCAPEAGSSSCHYVSTDFFRRGSWQQALNNLGDDIQGIA